MMIVRTSMGSESKDDATKITSALADSRIYSFMKMVTLFTCTFVAVSIIPVSDLVFLPVL